MTTGQAFTERDGRELAVSMLRELEDVDADLVAIREDERPAGTPQSNVVLRHLAAVRAADCRELEAGFGAVLTDFLASALNGAVPDATFYEDLIEDEA